jgi:hypothetical protein
MRYEFHNGACQCREKETSFTTVLVRAEKKKRIEANEQGLTF